MSTRLRRRLIVLIALTIVAALAVMAFDERIMPKLVRGLAKRGDGVFLVKPYLQLGDNPILATGEKGERAVLLWQVAESDPPARWSVLVRSEGKAPWRRAETPTVKRVAIEGVAPFRRYRVVLTRLTPGAPFVYMVFRDRQGVFQAEGRARKAAGQPQRFVVFGDGGADTWGQSAVAYQTYLARPDYVVVTGDVVYMRGRASEYLDHFFPIYNSDRAGKLWGAPLLRSTPFLTAAGNHDLIERDLDKHPDGLAYFYDWDQPLNGPEGLPGASGFPRLEGSAPRRKAFLDAAGPAYPRMGNYSFDYGDVHWTVLDTNTYADWTDPALRAWLDADLDAARGCPWRIVAFHHPAFSSSKAHREDQRMRVLAPTFERHGVAIVFNGHVHNYQRTRPLRFNPATPAGGPCLRA